MNRLSGECISSSACLKQISLFMGLGYVPKMVGLQNFFFRILRIVAFFNNKDSAINVRLAIMIQMDYFFFETD